MSLSTILKQLIAAGEGKYQEEFQKLDADVQIAIYQKLLFKAGETPEESNERKALASLNEPVFQNSLSPEVQNGIKIEQQRYAVAKANAIYQEYLSQKVLEKVAKRKDEEIELQEDLMFDPQGRLVYELTLSKEEQKAVLKKIEAALGIDMLEVDEREGIEINNGLKEVLGGRTPTDTTLCSIDLSGPRPEKGGDVYKKLQDKYKEIYGPQKVPHHQRASIVASFEETYAHMCLMAGTFERRSITYGTTKETINPEAWQDIRHKAAVKLQQEVAKAYKRAVEKATDPDDGRVNVDKLNKNLAKERTRLAGAAKKELIEGVVTHLKEQGKKLGKNSDEIRKDILDYTQKLSSSLDKHQFTARTATGFDYFYTSNYLQQGMLITGTQQTAHEKSTFDAGKHIEDQAAFRRVTYTYRDENGVLHPTSAVSGRLPSPALVFHPTMSAQDIKDDLVKKFGFLHEQMRAMRGGKDGPAVENLFTSFHSEAFETIGDRNNKQRASALYMMQAMHEFNAQRSARIEELKKKIQDVQTNPVSTIEEEEVREQQVKKLQEDLRVAKTKVNSFLYVQNIGTNRHTQDLGYRVDRSIFTGSVELDEITLSAEMAMLHTLQENSAFLSQDVKTDFFKINEQVLLYYNDFLNKENREEYFADSPEGKQLITEIRIFKEDLKDKLAQQDEDQDLPSLASNALARMIATNQHWDIRYGQLSQALSMYIEWASTGGCKSGNERNQDVMLRFALLKSIHERVEHNDGKLDKLQEHEKAIYDQIKAYAKGDTADPDALRAAIAVSVSKCNLHGGAAAISREDQGGAAKVSSFSFVQDIKSPFLRWTARIALGVFALATLPLLAIPPVRKFYINQLIDTNNAADREMNLDATGASKTQAHKGQDKRTREVVLEVLQEDELFNPEKGGIELTSKEKDGFKKTKGSHGGHEFQVVGKVEKEVNSGYNGSPQKMVNGLEVQKQEPKKEPKPRVLQPSKMDLESDPLVSVDFGLPEGSNSSEEETRIPTNS
uniref:hypothetical protein n=1 Tax=Legionella tucsonensis TaxID=40335 RepID=UPI00105521B4|nr:hypothetical protein [Legionella tucsonensis]